ncbi:flagellar export protein FliJ [Bacillus salipaludis]|uniref:Flagellar FliJ protein n=1 Tax=Bacillus salipaludis TaxID=2547811 RepID=A0ABW8REB4_9BACI
MKFAFSFQKVLDVKEKEQEMAKQEYGSTKLRQLELAEQIEGLELVKENVFKQYNDIDRKTVKEILELQLEIDHISHRMKMLEDQSHQIHQEVEQKHQVLIQKNQETKMWNQWKTKSMEAFQKQLDRSEQAMLDEMAVIRYTRRT